jgi:ABC-2 type transport system permease protein
MRVIVSLINREFWEQKSVFFSLPRVLTLLLCVAGFFTLVLGVSGHVDMLLMLQGHHAVVSELVKSFLFALSVPFMLVLWLTVFYYFLGALYDDRKDGSILFWRSLPVSCPQSLASKLIAGLILAPFCTWVCLMVAQIILLAFASVLLMVHPIIPWVSLWNPELMVSSWLNIFIIMIMQGLWLLPLLAWCFVCGAFAKKAPALRAIVPVLLIMLCDLIFTSKHYFSNFILSRFHYAFHAGSGLLPSTYARYSAGFWMQFSPGAGDMMVGVLVSIALIAVAGMLRYRCYDF